MEKVLRVLSVFFILVFILLAGPPLFQGAIDRIYLSTLTSSVYYEVSLTTNSSLDNVTLFLPLPVGESGTSPIIESIGNGSISCASTGWNLSIFGANNESFLKLWIDHLPPIIGGVQEVTYRFTSTATNNYAVNVTHPVEKGYALQPRHYLPNAPYGGNEALLSPLVNTYSSTAYISYNASEDTTVEITVALVGTNSWHIFREYHNEYRDSLSTRLMGISNGWQDIDGILITGIGDKNPIREEQPTRTITLRPATSLGYILHDIMSVRPLMSEWDDARRAPHAIPVYPPHP